MSVHEAMIFEDLEPIEIPVTIRGKDYVLKEATGDVAVKHRNAMMSCARLGEQGRPVGISGLADTEPFLISLCLFSKEEDGKLAPVSEATIRQWPNRIQKALFAKVQEISDLSDDDDSDERRLLGQLLNRPDAPISMDQLRQFAEAVPGDEYRPLRLWLRATVSERAKNGQLPTEVGSS